MKLFKSAILILFLSVTATAVTAQDKSVQDSLPVDKQQLIQVLEDFRSAIIENNREKASELLTSDARILESGGIETKEEYLSHHFHSDRKFLSAVQRHINSRNIKATETSAWISTTSHMSGTYNNRKISVNSAELAVLKKENDTWKISAVHWSSRNAE